MKAPLTPLHVSVFLLTTALLVVACTPSERLEPLRPSLPEVTPSYRTEVDPIFGIQFPSELEAPNHDQRAELGRVLFHDRMLSQNGAVSCNSCHLQSHGFAEPKALSLGLRRELTERNASHLVNPGSQFAYFWDGRADDLTTQVTMPIENHVEMGFRNLDDLASRLSQLNYYSPLFTAAYGDPEPSLERIQDALSTFLRCMVSCHSPADEAFAEAMDEFWDPWGVSNGTLTLNGLSSLEKQGFELFHGKAQCANCHGGPHFNGWGMDFADIGLDASTEEPDPNAFNNFGFFGGWGATAMKVPSLRNVALTGPYMHDGRFQTLDEVLDHYSHGIQDVPTLDGRLRNWDSFGGDEIFISPILPVFGNEGAPPVRLNFSPSERAALKAFLHSLTDFNFIQDERFSNPFTQPS